MEILDKYMYFFYRLFRFGQIFERIRFIHVLGMYFLCISKIVNYWWKDNILSKITT